MSDIQAAARRYVQRVLKELDIAPGALAKRAGVAPSTLTRFLNNSDHKYFLSSGTIQKLWIATRISPVELTEEDDYYKYLDEKNGDKISSHNYIPVVGEVQPGIWRDISRLEESDLSFGRLPITLSHWKQVDCSAVIVRGNSISSFAEDGDILVYVNFKVFISRFSIADGNIVIVERSAEDQNLEELSARVVRYRRQSDGKADAVDLYLSSRKEGFDISRDVIQDVSFHSGGVKGVRLVGVVLYAMKDAQRLHMR